MWVTAIMYGLVSAGVIIALQGYLRVSGNPQVAFFEKTLLEALRPQDEGPEGADLGRLRIVYGFFWLQ